VARHLAEIIETVEPDTVVTFGPDGLTGHEDHQTVSTWATAAHAAAGSGGRLLYATTTEEFTARWEPERRAFDVFLAEGLPLRTPASALAVELRLTPDLLDRKMVALRAQASQTTGLIDAIGEERMREWWSTETFVSAAAASSGSPSWGTGNGRLESRRWGRCGGRRLPAAASTRRRSTCTCSAARGRTRTRPAGAASPSRRGCYEFFWHGG
jgi:LmbE family N-acetylglucosaminyl deacetylase